MSSDLEIRKLNLITYITELNDEDFFQKIENFVHKKSVKTQKLKLKPFTKEELIERIKLSEEDYANGRYKTQKELEKDFENW